MKIRNSERIDLFTFELNRIWKEYFPDLRFGQLMSNFLDFVENKKGVDIFFPEELEILTYLREYCGEIK